MKRADGNDGPNPLVGIARRAADDMVSLAGHFGMSPAARARISAGVGYEPPPGGNSTGFSAKKEAPAFPDGGFEATRIRERAQPTRWARTAREPAMSPIRLSDDELDAVFMPLPADRSRFARSVPARCRLNDAAQGSKVIGPGGVVAHLRRATAPVFRPTPAIRASTGNEQNRRPGELSQIFRAFALRSRSRRLMLLAASRWPRPPEIPLAKPRANGWL